MKSHRDTNIDRREFLRKIALASAGGVLLPMVFARKAQALCTSAFYVSKNGTNTNDGNYGLYSATPWRTLEHAFGTINGDISNPDAPNPLYPIEFEWDIPCYLQGSDPAVSVVVNVGDGEYDQINIASPDYDPFVFGARANQHIKGKNSLPGFQGANLDPIVPSTNDFALIKTAGLDISADNTEIDSCFIYVDNPNGRIYNPAGSGRLKLKNSFLLGYQGPNWDIFNPGTIHTPNGGEGGVNVFDNSDLENNIIAGFDTGASDTSVGLTKMRRCLLWKNRNGVVVNGFPDLGGKDNPEDYGKNIFFNNEIKNLISMGGSDPIRARGNYWYDFFEELCATPSEIYNTMSGVVPLGAKADRQIDIFGFGTDDILNMPAVSGMGLAGLAGLVGAVGVYAIGRNRGREGYNSK